MANQQQLHFLLDQGVTVWNHWRRENPGVVVDLSQVTLRQQFLRHANFGQAGLIKSNMSWANLVEAIFVGADLRNANLMGADLTRADLSGSDLSGADLNEAKLTRACLNGANLRGAKLTWSDASEADLSGANLSNTDLFRARFIRANLTGAELNLAQLVRTDLRQAICSQLRLEGVDLSTADLRGTGIESRYDLMIGRRQLDPGYEVESEFMSILEETQRNNLDGLRSLWSERLDWRLSELKKRLGWLYGSQEELESWLTYQMQKIDDDFDESIRISKMEPKVRDPRTRVEDAIRRFLRILRYTRVPQSLAQQLEPEVRRRYEPFLYEEVSRLINETEMELAQLRAELRAKLERERPTVLGWARQGGHKTTEKQREGSAPEGSQSDPISNDVDSSSTLDIPDPSGTLSRDNKVSSGITDMVLATALEAGQPETGSSGHGTTLSTEMSLSHPRRLAKGYESLIKLNFRQSERISDMKTVQLFCPTLSFGASNNIVPIDNPTLVYKIEPSNSSNPGNHALLVTLRDTPTRRDLCTWTISVPVVDYAFGRVSRPRFLTWFSVVSGICAMALWVLAFWGRIDAVLGYVLGAVAASGAVFFAYQVQSQYRATDVTNSYECKW